MSEITNPIEQTSEMLSFANDSAKELLSGNPSVLLLVTSNLTQLINKLNFMTGRQTASTPAVEHPPITNFMGEEITYANKINKADLTPAQADREAFIDKVERLYTQFDTITPQGLLNSYTLPEDQLVIRGVAKRAGVEDYEDRTIDEDFIEDIAIAINNKKADDAQQAEIERQLQNDQQKSQVTKEGDEDDTVPGADEVNKKVDDAQQAENNGTGATTNAARVRRNSNNPTR
jgi:hypothetical protein